MTQPHQWLRHFIKVNSAYSEGRGVDLCREEGLPVTPPKKKNYMKISRRQTFTQQCSCYRRMRHFLFHWNRKCWPQLSSYRSQSDAAVSVLFPPAQERSHRQLLIKKLTLRVKQDCRKFEKEHADVFAVPVFLLFSVIGGLKQRQRGEHSGRRGHSETILG